jgi:hypothetical protein
MAVTSLSCRGHYSNVCRRFCRERQTQKESGIRFSSAACLGVPAVRTPCAANYRRATSITVVTREAVP